MEIQSLLNTCLPDIEIFEDVCEEIQGNYAKYLNHQYYIGLRLLKDDIYEVHEIRVFSDVNEHIDFVLDERPYDSCIRFRKIGDKIDAQLLSEHHFAAYDIWDGYKVKMCFSKRNCVEDMKSSHHLLLEFCEGFSEISKELTQRTFTVPKSFK